jgi:hypothetical protein
LLKSKEWQDLETTIKDQNMHFTTKTSWYNRQAKLLLEKAVPSAYITPIAQLNSPSVLWEGILLEANTRVVSGVSSVLIPININNVHWTEMIIKPIIGGHQVIIMTQGHFLLG